MQHAILYLFSHDSYSYPKTLIKLVTSAIMAVPFTVANGYITLQFRRRNNVP